MSLQHQLLSKGDRTLVRGSQRLKRTQEIELGRALNKYYKDLGKGMSQALQDGGESSLNSFIDQMGFILRDILLENNTKTAGILGDFQMRQLEKSSAQVNRVKVFEEEIVGQLDNFLLAEATRSVFFITSEDKRLSARIIALGISDGQGTAPIARSLQTQFSGVLGQVRSQRISRTEVGIVGSKAQNQGAVNLGAKSKQWIQISDQRAREIHTDVDGISLGMEDLFFPGGEGMAFPHDVRGSAANIINCRCDILYSR
jgi:hypothetical protein